MINYQEILNANPTGVLATQNGEGVGTRAVRCLFTEGNKVYFSTSSEKPMFEQMMANPNVSFCTYPKNFTPVLSIHGKVIFVENLKAKEHAINESEICKNAYKTPDNPIFKLFYIDVSEVDTYIPSDGTKRYKIQ